MRLDGDFLLWYDEQDKGCVFMKLANAVLEYIKEHEQEALELLMELAVIPAPSHHEERRAAFCKQWLERQGAQGVYIDEALNVVWPIGCTEDNDLAVFMAHSDVVFPDTDTLPMRVENGRIHCPGVCDDTANVVAMLMAAKYIAQQNMLPSNCGVLLVVNSGEEGLGNLKGCRRIMQDYGSRIREFVTFDDKNGQGVDRAVGSMRYRVAVETEGGHSFSNFGRPNAIAQLAALIADLYKVEVPDYGRTTYNVGTVEGGTSVNTIAQQAEMLYEFRSDDQRGLAYMQQRFDEIIAAHKSAGVSLAVTKVGDRPCGGDINAAVQQEMKQRADDAAMQYLGRHMHFKTGSTDCNIPLSMGIASICVGCCDGDGCHTREEYLDVKGIYPGLCMAFAMILQHF